VAILLGFGVSDYASPELLWAGHVLLTGQAASLNT